MIRGETCPIEVLLVEDSPSDALLLQESLLETGLGAFVFTHVECWADASRCLCDKEFDVLLLDLSLPDVAGQDTFLRARAEAPHLPIVVLTGTGNEVLGLEAVRHGIQDYLVKGRSNERQTARSIRYSIERKRVEETLQTASERHRLVLEAAGMGVWDYCFDTSEISWDERCRNMWGVTQRDRIDYASAIAAIHPADRAAFDGAVKRVLAGEDGGVYHREFRVVWPDGTVHWIDSSGQVFCEGEGKHRRAVRFICAIQDITERKRAQEQIRALNAELEQHVAARTAELRQTNEQLRREIEVRRQTEQELSDAELRYRTVADFTYDWEYWKTPEGLLQYCSPSCERVTGYTSSELAVSPELLSRIIYPLDREIWQRHESEAMAHPAPRSILFRIRRKDGVVRWIEHTCQPVIGSGGEFLGLRASNRDVSERKQAEMDMQQLREELAHVTRVSTAGQLAASLAHELNQPLTAIRCNAETAERLLAAAQPNVAEAREALDDISRDSERAGGVIEGLRALFHKTTRERRVLQVNSIINETLDLLRSQFVLQGITPQVELEPTLPEVLGDRIELQQVVLNLLVNAVESMSQCEPGLRRLQIATGCDENGEVCVSVRDSGHGIQVQPISRLFEPFFTTKSGGMGMGLAISHSIIEAHGGTLRAMNNPDRGATFRFALPICQGDRS